MGLRGYSGVRTRRNAGIGFPKPAEADPTPVVPDAPADLSGAAREWWARLVPGLVEADVLAGIDLTGLRLLCQCLAEVDACEARLAAEGMTVTQTNKAGATNLVSHPLIRVRNAARVQATQLLKGLAMVPAVRGVRGLLPTPAVDDLTRSKLAHMSDEQLRVEYILNPQSAAGREWARRQKRTYFGDAS